VNKLLKYIFSKTCKISISTLSIFLIFYFLGVGLDSASPTRSLAQASDQAGLSNTRALTHACCGKVLGSVVAVAFQITFCAEIHANDVFLFFKNYF
jgi:hypothetical protein